MRQLFVLFSFVLVFAATNARAQGVTSGWIELEGVVTEKETTPSINVYAHGPLKGRVGWTLYMQAMPEWGEGLFGLTFAPAPWLEVSGSLGLENFERPFRRGATLWMGRSKYSLLSIQEHGGSGHWQKNVGKFQLTPTIAVGGLQQTFIGFGPYVEKRFGRLTLWSAYAATHNKGLVTAQFKF